MAHYPKFAYTAEQIGFVNALQIPSDMHCTGTPLTLKQHYVWYLVYLNTLATLRKMQRDGTWTKELRVPGDSDIRLLFIGKSTWHNSWSKTFPYLKDYPEMKNWITDDEDYIDDIELWCSNHKAYHFPELALWLKTRGVFEEAGEERSSEEGIYIEEHSKGLDEEVKCTCQEAAC